MALAFDLAYRTLAAASAVSPRFRRKLQDAQRRRDGTGPTPPDDGRPLIVIHGVSVGETHAARPLIEELRRLDPHIRIAAAASTVTGTARAKAIHGVDPAADVFADTFPLDLSAYVDQHLNRLRPVACVMMELEVWPNYVRECERRGVPVFIANGRITQRAFDGYRRTGPILRPTFRRLTRVFAQDETYAERFRRLGVPAERVEVTGSVKYDAAIVGERAEGDAEYAASLGLSPRAWGGSDPVVVAGSTGPGEEALLLDAWEHVLRAVPNARLVLVPRKPERFESVAELILARHRLVRRSSDKGVEDPAAIRLGDSMGELRKAYAMADVVVVGRTLLELGERQHGSDPLEPAALGKPLVLGGFSSNFAEPVARLAAARAARQVAGEPEAVASAVIELVRDAEATRAAGAAGRAAVQAAAGASAATAERIRQYLKQSSSVASR
jgi:3-deoxy-D-manno-octulosonic-acid transferase